MRSLQYFTCGPMLDSGLDVFGSNGWGAEKTGLYIDLCRAHSFQSLFCLLSSTIFEVLWPAGQVGSLLCWTLPRILGGDILHPLHWSLHCPSFSNWVRFLVCCCFPLPYPLLFVGLCFEFFLKNCEIFSAYKI